MSDQLIDQIADRAAITSDQQFVDGVLDDIFGKFQQISDLKIKLTTDSSFQAAAQTVATVKKAQDDLSLSVKAYGNIVDQTAKNQAQFNANTSAGAAALATSKVALAAQNAQLTSTAKLQATANNSVGEAIALVNQLKIARNAISIVDEQSKQKVADLNTQIDLNNKFINENTSGIEQQKNNVGNYIGAVGILKDALDEVNGKIAANTAAGQDQSAAQQQLIKEQQLLNAAVGRQVEGFSSLAVELRTNQQLLATMSAAGLSGTKAFEELREKVDDTQKEYSEFREQQKLLGNATGGFEAIIKGAEGLVGVYGATVSAGKLFGKNNEELEQGMVKLEAVIALLNSLQGIERGLHEATAIAVTIEAAAKKALAAATELVAFVTEGATIAMKAFNAALAATGIGAVVLLLASFVNELLKATAGTNAAIESQAKYNDTLKDYEDILSKNNDAFLKYAGQQKEQLQDELALLEAQGAQFRELQAVKQAIAAEDQKNAVEGLKNLGVANSSIDDQGKALDDARASVEALQDQYNRLGDELAAYEKIREEAAKKAADAGDDPEKDRGVLRADAFIKSLKASQEALAATIDPAEKLIEQYDKGTISLKTLTAELDKYNKEQQENQSFTNEKNRLDAVIAANAAIVADDHRTENERLQALKDGAAAQEALQNRTLQHDNSQPGLSDEQKAINAKNTAASIQKIQVDTRKQTSDLTRAYDDADFQYQTDIQKSEIQQQIDKNNVIIADEKNSYQSRQAAALDNYRKQTAINAAELVQELNDKTATADQIAAAQAKANTADQAALIAYQKQTLDLTNENNQKILQAGITAGEQNLALIKTQYDERLIVLNNLRINDQVSEAKFQQERIKLDATYEQQELQVEIQNAYLKVNATKAGTAERAKAEQDLADLVAKLSNNQVGAVEDAEKKKQEAVLKTLSAVQSQYDQVADVIGKALDAQVTAQKNAIQAQINNLKDQETAQIQAVNNQVLSETDKAAKIAIIQANAQDATEALQRRQKQLDIEKAEFDKIKSIGTIILKTAEAVATDLTKPEKIPFDIAVGAAELAIAIAAPVPTFALGGDHDGGALIVGDGGRSELMETPDGHYYVTPSHSVLVPNMPAGTHIYPDARQFLADMPESVVYSSGGRQANGLEEVFIRGMKGVAQAINDKHELHINPNFNSIMAIHKYGNSHVQWVADNVQF